MRSRLDAIEANIRAFTGDVSTLISEERTRRAKRAFDESEDFSRKMMRTSHQRSRCHFAAQRGRSADNQDSSPGQVIPVVDIQERSPAHIPLFDDNYEDGSGNDEDGDDEYGVHYARKCIEDARAKRRKESIWS